MPPTPGITRQFHVLIELQPEMALQTLLLGIYCAFAGTLLASWRVVRMPIDDVLRSI